MSVIRESHLLLRDAKANKSQPSVLMVRVYDHTNLCGGGWFEMRGEDPEGNVIFSLRDARKILVLEEFESTVEDLLCEYRPAEELVAAHG